MTKPVRVRMDPKWKKRWVKALRSGKYKQDTGQLKSNEGFCCLGVLCDVVSKYPKSGGGGSWIDGDFKFGNDSNGGVVPRTVRAVVGLTEGNPEVASGGKKLSLSMWNDERGFTFEQIANIVEREL